MSTNLDYALTEDIDWRDEWVEAEHPRKPQGAPGGGQFATGGAGGGAPLPKPVGLSSPLAHSAYEMATTGGFTGSELVGFGEELIKQGKIKANSKIAVYIGELATAKEQQGSAQPAPSATEIPHNAGMINASVNAETAYLLAMQPSKTAQDIQSYLDKLLTAKVIGPNSPSTQYIQQIIKAKKAQQAAHGSKAAEQVDIQAEPAKQKTIAPAMTPKQQGEYAAGTATTEIATAAKDPAKLAKLAAQSHAIGQSLNTPEAVASAAVQDAKISIATWTTPGPTGFHMITDHLMGKATSEKAAYHADMIQKAILSNSIPESVNAYRGVHGDMFQEIQTKQPGDAWTIKKFQATTIDPRKATYYAKGGKGGAMIHYVLPKGQKALYVSDPKLNAWEGEHELLLPAGSTIKLVGTSSVELPEYDYTGTQKGGGGPVTVYHVEVMQPGSPEFEAAHPRGEGGKFVAKPGSEALAAEEEKFDGGAFDPDPDMGEPIPEPWWHLVPSEATEHAKAIHLGLTSNLISNAAALQNEIDDAIKFGLILKGSAQHNYLEDLHAAVEANEAKAYLSKGQPAPTAAPTSPSAFLAASAPASSGIPDLPADAKFVAKIVWNGAINGKPHDELATWAETQINNGKMTENGPQHEYVKQVLAAVKAKEGGGSAIPPPPPPPPGVTPLSPSAVVKPMSFAAGPQPPPEIPQEIEYDKDAYQFAMAEDLKDWGHAKNVSAAEIKNYLVKKLSSGQIKADSPLHKYAQAVIAAKEGNAAPTAEPVAYPAPFLPIEMPKPDLPNAPSAEHAYEQVTGRAGEGVEWLKKYIKKSLKNTNYETGDEGVVVAGSDEHKYLQKLLRTLQQQKYAAQNAAQQPELFAPSTAPAPPPPPPKPKLGTGDPSDYGRSHGSSVSPVRAVYATTNTRRARIGEEARGSAVRVYEASAPEAEKACPSLKRTWWKKQSTEIRDSCRDFLSGSKGINGALLGGAASSAYGSGPQELAHAENIDAAFEDDAAVVKQDIRAFRGTSMNTQVIAELKQALADGKPALWERRGFTSLSLADNVHSTFEGDVYLNVTVRKGTRALGLFGLGRDSGYEKENELLLRAGRPLEVYAIHEHEDGKHTIFAYTQN